MSVAECIAERCGRCVPRWRAERGRLVAQMLVDVGLDASCAGVLSAANASASPLRAPYPVTTAAGVR
jgi:hypothetical protein